MSLCMGLPHSVCVRWMSDQGKADRCAHPCLVAESVITGFSQRARIKDRKERSCDEVHDSSVADRQMESELFLFHLRCKGARSKARESETRTEWRISGWLERQRNPLRSVMSFCWKRSKSGGLSSQRGGERNDCTPASMCAGMKQYDGMDRWIYRAVARESSRGWLRMDGPESGQIDMDVKHDGLDAHSWWMSGGIDAWMCEYIDR